MARKLKQRAMLQARINKLLQYVTDHQHPDFDFRELEAFNVELQPLQLNAEGNTNLEQCFFKPMPIRKLEAHPVHEEILGQEDLALLEFEDYKPDKEEELYEWQRTTGFRWKTNEWEPEARAECILAYFEAQLFHILRRNVELCGLWPLVHWERIKCGSIPYREKHTLIADMVIFFHRAGHPFILNKGKLCGWPTSKTPRWKTVQCSEYEEEGSSYPHITLVTLQSVNGGEKLLFGELAPLVQAICNR